MLVASLRTPVGIQAATQSQAATLLDGQISITKLADTSAGVGMGQRCTNMTLQVSRNVLNTLVAQPETHCMVSTGAGLIDSSSTIIQPMGMSKAYPLSINRGGQPVLLPIKNSESAFLLTNDTAYPGVNVGIYNDLSANLKFSSNPFNMKYSLTGDPDTYLRYPDGRSLAANFIDSTYGVSNNGRYLVIDGVYQGFERVDLMSMRTTLFAEDLPRANGYGLLSAATGISSSGKYAAVAYSAPGGWGNKYLKIVDVDSCEATVASCKTADVYARLKSAVPSLGSIDRVDFSSDSSLLVTARYDFDGHTSKEGQFVISTPGQNDSGEEYLAMGDSYISGEGAGKYLYGTDTSDNKCHQSLVSYPYLLGAKLNSVASVACSGATMDNVTGIGSPDGWSQLQNERQPSAAEKQTALDSHMPGYIVQSDFVLQDNPAAITLSVGGNDIGFTDVVMKCIVPFNNFSALSQNCYSTYQERVSLLNQIDGQFNNLYMTYLRLRENAPQRRLYVIGYPQIINPAGSCGANVHLSKPDGEFAVQLVDYFDSVISMAAAKAGVRYIDTRQAFDGHRLCDTGQKAVNGLTKGDDRLFIVAKESYHPNAYGNELLADYIARATNNLTAPMPQPQDVTNPTSNDVLPILSAVTHSSGLVYTIKNANKTTLELLFSGKSYAIPHLASPLNLAPNSLFTVVLHSTPMQLGIVSTDVAGVIGGSVTVPADVTPGLHTLHYYGTDIAGEPVDIQDVVYIAKSQNDYDGDGISNDSDSCPSMPQSGEDADKDGIDDACDGDIGASPAIRESSTVNVGQDDKQSNFAFVLTNTTKASVPKVAQTAGIIPDPGHAKDVGKVLGLSINPTAKVPDQKSDQVSYASNMLVLIAGIASIILITGMTVSIAKSRKN